MASTTNKPIRPETRSDQLDTSEKDQFGHRLQETNPFNRSRIEEATRKHGIMALREAEPQEKRSNEVPRGKRLAAILGIETDGEIKSLGKEMKVLSITLPISRLAELNEAVGDLALPCDDTFIGADEDGTITMNFVVPDYRNSMQISHALKDRRIPAQVVINRNENAVLHLTAGRLIPLATNLYSDPEELEETRLTQIIGNKDRKGYHRTGVNISNTPDNVQAATPTFSHKELTSASLANTENRANIPPNSQGVYLAIDLDDFDDSQSLENPLIKNIIPNVIRSFLNSGQFHVVSHNGFLIIMSTAETLGRVLIQTAIDIKENPTMFIGRVEMKQLEEATPRFTATGLPDRALRKAANIHKKSMKGPHLVGEDFNREMNDGESRDARGCIIKSQATAVPNAFAITTFKPVIESYRHGGPKFTIGAKKDLSAVKAATESAEARVIELVGPGGIGKSTAIDYYIQNGKIANPVKIFIDPGESSIAGSALASSILYLAADAVTRKKKGELGELNDEEQHVLTAFSKFAKMTANNRRNLAVQHSEDLEKAAVDYLEMLAKNYRISPIFDNFEASDEASLPHLLNIIQAMAAHPAKKCKTYITRRSERRYASTQTEECYQSIVTAHRKEAVAKINVEGNDYKDQELSRKFLVGCLEKALGLGLADTFEEFDQETATKYQVDPEITGAIAGIDGLTALQLTNIIAGIAPELQVNESNVITLKPDQRRHFNTLAKIKSSRDLSRFHAGILKDLKIRAPKAKKVLAILAITGGKIPLASVAASLDTELAELEETTISILREEGYIVQTTEGQYAIHHSAFAQTILAGSNKRELAAICEKLYTQIRKDPSIDDSSRLAVLANMSPLFRTQTQWEEYLKIALAVFTHPQADHYTAALAVLDKFDPDSSSEVLMEIASPTAAPDQMVRKIQELAAHALAALAKSAVIRGRFDEVQEAIGNFEKLKIVIPQQITEEMYLAGFHAARREEQALGKNLDQPNRKNTLEFKQILDRLLTSDHQKRLIKLRYSYGQAQNDPSEYSRCQDDIGYALSEEAIATMSAEELMTHLHDTMEVDEKTAIAMTIMLKIRIPLETTIQEVEKDTDADMTMQPGTLTIEQTQRLLKAQKDVKHLEDLIAKNPAKIEVFDLLSLKEARAQLAALLAYEKPEGDMVPFQEAIKLYEEAAGMARRRGLHFETARILQLMAKTMITSAHTALLHWPTQDSLAETKPRAKASPLQLREALKILKEALVPLANIPEKNDYHLIIHSDRVRLVSILYSKIDETRLDDDEKYKEEMISTVKEVLEQDVKQISEKFGHLQNDPLSCYYCSYSIEIIRIAELLNEKYDAKITIPDCPFANHEAATKAKTYHFQLETTPTGRNNINALVTMEVARKMAIVKAKLAETA